MKMLTCRVMALQTLAAFVTRIASASSGFWLFQPEVSLKQRACMDCWQSEVPSSRHSTLPEQSTFNTQERQKKNHPYWFSCQPKRPPSAERCWIGGLYFPNRQSRVAIREIYTLECPACALFVLPCMVWQLCLRTRRTVDTRFTAPPPVFLAPFRKSAVLSQRKDRMFQPKNYHHLFHSVTPSIRRTPTTPKRASHGAPRKKRGGWEAGGREPIRNRKINVAPAGLDAFTSALNDCRLISSAPAAITKQQFLFFFFMCRYGLKEQRNSV